MLKNPLISDIGSLKITVVYKRSRFTYAQENGTKEEQKKLEDHSDPIIKNLFRAHENNLFCISKIESVLRDLRLEYSLLCRSDLTSKEVNNRFIICVGGDGTLLDTSHYCADSPVLGVNSDPNNSIGALCAANADNILSTLEAILKGEMVPMPVTRLSIRINGKLRLYRPLNDVLFCHENPAAMSRYYLEHSGAIESHRSSGIWVSTGAGSTGGIFSSGANAFAIDDNRAIFRVREPYWTDQKIPKLLDGDISKEALKITSNMSNGKLFIDGPHKSIRILLGQEVEISLSKEPLWLFDKATLLHKREKIIEQRKPYRKILNII
jgi:NAD+ kinase